MTFLAMALAASCLVASGAWAQRATTATKTDATTATRQLVVQPKDIAQESAMPANPDQLRFNFQGVPLSTVLDYMSRAGGFIIVGTRNIDGQVDVVSHQPVTRDEAVNLLDSILFDKGYTSIRNDRELKIVPIGEAPYSLTPIAYGSDPEKIPNSDRVVVQIMPVRHATASALLNDIRPLLAATATITANESSNAIVLTDAQSSIRRVAEVINKLDQAINSITTLKVFKLKYADSKATAQLITSIFQVSGAQGAAGGNNRGGRGMFGGPGGGPGGPGQIFQAMMGGGGNNAASSSAALQAASRVTASSDDRTNSVVIGAPAEMMPTIEELIVSLDKSSDVLTVVKVFPMTYASASDMATQITNLFGGSSSSSSSNSTNSGRVYSRNGGFGGGGMGGGGMGGGGRGGGGMGGGGFGGGGMGGGGGRGGATGGNNASSDLSSRQLAASTVTAVADTRTNSVIVSAVQDVMDQIADVIKKLDQNPAKSKKVFVYKVAYGDPQAIASMLQSMFGSSSGTSSSSNSSTSTNRNSSSSSSSNNNNNSSNSSRNSSSSSRNSSSGSNGGIGTGMSF
jgi:general secretion pathway protein D